MGNTFEVLVWRAEFRNGLGHHLQVWQGESLLRALWVAWRQHRAGEGCVTIKWRSSR